MVCQTKAKYSNTKPPTDYGSARNQQCTIQTILMVTRMMKHTTFPGHKSWKRSLLSYRIRKRLASKRYPRSTNYMSFGMRGPVC
mmetsp:Transcript_46744/g.89278  ORF Transcript_46744/g.89278 Transcript_46744/m.89278 type:complete len:84 (+) Transcript_46744:1133-1384(+)